VISTFFWSKENKLEQKCGISLGGYLRNRKKASSSSSSLFISNTITFEDSINNIQEKNEAEHRPNKDASSDQPRLDDKRVLIACDAHSES
jgi:hypothetical protein